MMDKVGLVFITFQLLTHQ